MNSADKINADFLSQIKAFLIFFPLSEDLQNRVCLAVRTTYTLISKILTPVFIFLTENPVFEAEVVETVMRTQPQMPTVVKPSGKNKIFPPIEFICLIYSTIQL